MLGKVLPALAVRHFVMQLLYWLMEQHMSNHSGSSDVCVIVELAAVCCG
jgi:hypothetical protein